MTAFASLTARPLRNDTAANPRWAACTRELGREPSQGEFGVWCLRRWDDYFEAVNLGTLKGLARASACRAHGRAFEAWLVRRSSCAG
jgi:hypothetical protein